jgi:hypothetical protein
MRHILYHQAREFVHDTEQPCTHAVLGQRDRAADELALATAYAGRLGPAADGKDATALYFAAIAAGALTEEERIARAKFAFDETHGWYASKVLVWCDSEKNAKERARHFKTAGWINLTIQSVDTVIPHA